jgi:ATP-dependent RNA helicase DHX36
MSATLQEQKFSDYFSNNTLSNNNSGKSNNSSNVCPIVYVSGRCYPVTMHYLPEIERIVNSSSSVVKYSSSSSGKKGNKNNNNSGNNKKKEKGDESGQQQKHINDYKPYFDPELIAGLVATIINTSMSNNKPGNNNNGNNNRGEAILVFLSGIQAIEKVQKAIPNRLFGSHSSRHNNNNSNNNSNIMIYILHDSLSAEQQCQVFRKTLPGQYKIVLATNIAETSITVDDVIHVIDSGYMKEQRYDPANGLSILQEVVISRCHAQQRAGRAGRVQQGHCWRLYEEELITNPSNNPWISKLVPEFPLPEIQRIAIEEVVLQVLLLKLGRPEVFLGQCLEPPSLSQLKAGITCSKRFCHYHHYHSLPWDIISRKCLVMFD